MSSNLHTEIIRSRQREAATQQMRARHAHEASIMARGGRIAIRRRIVGALAAAGLCVAVATTTPVIAHASQRASRVGHTATTSGLSRPHAVFSGASDAGAARFAAGVRKLERKGYVRWLCTRTGMLMHDTSTGRFATVRW